ncbi:MAG TPA: isoamylase early set domain-containing protein [Gemmatimonadaceae bacterium]|nr:isoamylase early set domain-containing protein [Gemmatimonadaceae bacterium]
MADEQEWDELDAHVRRELHRPARVDPTAIGRIMAEVRTSPRTAMSPVRDALAWLFRPRPFALSPAGALAALCVVAVVGGVAVRTMTRRAAPAPTVAELAPPAAIAQNVARAGGQRATQNVQFVFVNSDASTVSVVGDFNDWDLAATPLRRTGSGGIWSVVVPLPAGEHHYSYVVDGKTWVPDASAPQAPAGEFGGTNSVLFVGGRS